MDAYTIFTVIVAVVVGFVVWYCSFGIECCNRMCDATASMHRRQLLQEILWIMPGGYKRRLDFCDGDEREAKNLPGIGHFIIRHLLIPFGVAGLVIVLSLSERHMERVENKQRRLEKSKQAQ